MLKKSLIISILTIGILFNFLNVKVLADPNSSQGFLDYSEEDQLKEEQELEQAQNPTEPVTEVKSSNNYLKDLSIRGYKISPTFDKQTINYEVKKEVLADIVTIEAEADDTRATVSGIGQVNLNDGENTLKVDVTAENGSVRSYYIKVVKKEKIEKKETENDLKIQIESTHDDYITTSAPTNFDNVVDKASNPFSIAVAFALILILIAVIIAVSKDKNKKKKAKRGKRRR